MRLSEIDERTLIAKRLVVERFESKLKNLKGREKRELEETIKKHQADIFHLEKIR